MTFVGPHRLRLPIPPTCQQNKTSTQKFHKQCLHFILRNAFRPRATRPFIRAKLCIPLAFVMRANFLSLFSSSRNDEQKQFCIHVILNKFGKTTILLTTANEDELLPCLNICFLGTPVQIKNNETTKKRLQK